MTKLKPLKAPSQEVLDPKKLTYISTVNTSERDAVFQPENFGVELGQTSKRIRKYLQQTPVSSNTIVGANWIQQMCQLAKGKSYTSQGTTNLFAITLAGTNSGKSLTQDRLIIDHPETDFSSAKNILAHLRSHPDLTLKLDEASQFYEKMNSQNNRGISQQLMTLERGELGTEKTISRNLEELKGEEQTVLSPAFSIVGSSTLAGMSSVFSEQAIRSGATNRIVFFMGQFDGIRRIHQREPGTMINPYDENWVPNKDIQYTQFTPEAKAFEEYIQTDMHLLAHQLGIGDLSARWLSHARKIAQAIAYLDSADVTPELLNWTYTIIKTQGLSFYAQMITTTSDEIYIPDWFELTDFRKSSFPKQIKGQSLLETKKKCNKYIREGILILEEEDAISSTDPESMQWRSTQTEIPEKQRSNDYIYRVKSNPESKVQAIDMTVKIMGIPDFTPQEIELAKQQLKDDRAIYNIQYKRHSALMTNQIQPADVSHLATQPTQPTYDTWSLEGLEL